MCSVHRLGVLASALATAGCFGAPDTGAAGPGGSAASESSTSASFMECGPLGSLGRGSCAGFDAYTACMTYECAAGYDMCLGAEWRSAEHAGAVCDELMACIEDSADPCNHVCAAGADCQNCLTGQLSACEAYCAELLDCSLTGETRTGACAELEACCNRQEEPIRDLCLLDLSDVETAGESGCSALFSSYCAN